MRVAMSLRTLLVSDCFYTLWQCLNYFPDLVGSALSDPYLAYSAALLGLAGPLHGYANIIHSASHLLMELP